MNYGDPNPPTGKARVPGPPGGYGPDDDAWSREAAGRGGFSPSSGTESSGTTGRATVGRATVGRASVPAPGGDGDRPTGRASVGGAGGAAGRASVGRASVRPVSPGGPGPGDVIEGPGAGRRPPPMATKRARAKKRRLRNWVIAGIAAFVMLAGGGIVGGTYFFVSIVPPDQLAMPQSTTIYYADGVTPMAKIGSTNRTLIPYKDMPVDVQHAVVSAEDRSFYSNNGVDYKGIMRAAWNNVTGGERQGASTIAQQYARNQFKTELSGVSYSRKLREAVIAVKIKNSLGKDKIMEYYLDTVYFGRSAYGIEAAANAYFGIPAKQLTVAQGIALAALIKQPEGPKGSPYDYTRNPQSALDRFNYVRDGMVQLGFVKKEDADKLVYPKDTMKPYNPADLSAAAQYGKDTPTGFVVHHVLDELTSAKDAATGESLFSPEDLNTGGYRIITTIDKKMEDAAILYASRGPGSVLEKQPQNLTAALVAVEPGTGRVRAYYGGANGSGLDMAGVWKDPVLGDGKESGTGHPPGSSFKIYTLGAALKDGISIKSYWNGSSPREFPKSGRTGKNSIKNSGDSCPAPPGCQLWQAVQNSMNTPMFAVTETLTAAKVIDFARQAGVHSMWYAAPDGSQTRFDLTAHKPSEISPKYFSTEVGIGQYPITVAEHANGVATVAARGLAATEHFVSQVTKDNQLKYGEQINPKQIPGYTKAMGDDEDWTLQQVMEIKANGKNKLAGGRPAGGKTGTWQKGLTTDNAHAWFVGFTASDPAKKATGLATAVWVGNKGDELAIKDSHKNSIYGSSLPGDIWKRFMDAALKGAPVAKFGAPQYTGSEDRGELPVPDQNAPPPGGDGQGGPGGPGGPGGGQPCDIPALCPTAPPTKPGGGGPGGGVGGGGGIPIPGPTRTKH